MGKLAVILSVFQWFILSLFCLGVRFANVSVMWYQSFHHLFPSSGIVHINSCNTRRILCVIKLWLNCWPFEGRGHFGDFLIALTYTSRDGTMLARHLNAISVG